MSSDKFILIVALSFTLAPGCTADKQTAEKHTPVNPSALPLKFDASQQIGAWVDMWNTYDLSGVDKLFFDSENATYFSSEKEGLIIGIEALRRHHEGFGFVPGGKIQDNKLWVANLHTNIFGPVAVVTGIWYFEKGPRENRQVQRGPVTFVYVATPDGYRLAHTHFAGYN
jgi:hypothetical protein